MSAVEAKESFLTSHLGATCPKDGFKSLKESEKAVCSIKLLEITLIPHMEPRTHGRCLTRGEPCQDGSPKRAQTPFASSHFIYTPCPANAA